MKLAANCSSTFYSDVVELRPGLNDKCFSLKQRRALWIGPDPDPSKSQVQGCMVLFNTDDCSDDVPKSELTAMSLKSDRSKRLVPIVMYCTVLLLS